MKPRETSPTLDKWGRKYHAHQRGEECDFDCPLQDERQIWGLGGFPPPSQEDMQRVAGERVAAREERRQAIQEWRALYKSPSVRLRVAVASLILGKQTFEVWLKAYKARFVR